MDCAHCPWFGTYLMYVPFTPHLSPLSLSPSLPLTLQSCVVQPGVAEDASRVAAKALELLSSRERRSQRLSAQADFDAQRERAEYAWRRVEALVARNDVIGRGASSVVYRGSLDDSDPDEPLVAVKVGVGGGGGRGGGLKSFKGLGG